MEESKTINYILPGFLNISRNEIIINIYENYKYITRDNSKIHSFFGNFPDAIWNGGRLCLGERSSIKYMKKVRDFHNKHNIAIALTMTNRVLKEEHLNDKYCNDILCTFNNGKNEVLVSYPKLEEHIRKNYPNIKINKSITSTTKDGFESKDYNLSVLAVRYTNNFDFIKNIPLEERKRMEVLCDEPCRDNCKYKYIHYDELNLLQLGNAPSIENQHTNYANCRYRKKDNLFFYNWNKQRAFYISPDNIYKNYLPLGITHMKVNGREKNQYYGYENICDYCIKPEYQLDTLTYMLERLVLEYEDEVKSQINRKGIYTEETDSELHKWIKENESRIQI